MKKVERVNQIESDKIDDECKDILTSKLQKAFEFFDPSVLRRFKSEIKLVVNFFYYRYTIARDISLPGHEIQNIKFASRNEKREFGPLTKKQKILFLLLDIIGGYVADKMRAHFENTQDHELSKTMVIAKKTFQWLDKIYKLLSLINFVLFIRTFKYHTLVERILKIEYDHIRQGVRRTLDFEYMNRTIIWNVLSDFMAFALPYMQYGFGEMLKKMFFFTTFIGSISIDMEGTEMKCGICRDEKMTLPYKTTQCDCKFCYYCLKSLMQEKSQEGKTEYHCPACKTGFSEIEPVHLSAA